MKQNDRLTLLANALSARQRVYLLVAYDEDQSREASHRVPGLSPPRVWRWMEYGPVGGRQILGDGPLRAALEPLQLVDSGAGSTWAMLADRGLVLQAYRATLLPRMPALFIRMTPAGRRVARILKGLPIHKPKAAPKPLSLIALRLLHHGQQHPDQSFHYLEPWAQRAGVPEPLLALSITRGLLHRGLLCGDHHALRITANGLAVDVTSEPHWRPFRVLARSP